MNIVCLDLEGVLVPEVWVALSGATGIPELMRTTKDEPDYDKLMHYRINILREHGIGLRDLRQAVSTIDPLPGAVDFLDELRSITQALIVSDTFEQYAMPLMEKLHRPLMMCNELVIEDDMITDVHMRIKDSKLSTVRGLQSIGFDTIAVGDSFNDLAMIKASKAGFLFRSTEAIKAANPEVTSCEAFSELMEHIKGAL